MTVTLKDLSKASGVSVGTVSRALNDKSEVSAETARRIRELAQELGYVPNRAGKALSAQKNLNTVGILLPSINGPFFEDIKQGINEAEQEFKDLGLEVMLREVEGWDVDEHVRTIEELRDHGCKALGLCTVDTDRIRDSINDLEHYNIPVLLINNMVQNCHNVGFVGPDYERSGEIAAALLHKSRGYMPLKILIVVGLKSHHGHSSRVQGFMKELERCKCDFEVMDVIEGMDNDITTQQVTMEALRRHPEINCIYMATGSGVSGLGAAIIADSVGKFFVIACDEIYTTRELVKSDIIDFVICQEPRIQGYQAIKRLHEYITKPRSGKMTNYIVGNIIKLKNHFE
ncbi:MAG: substrate-binding domain-containing protein [Candidatus Anaerobiospirillum pullicola]|uniref:Substrate-binding domain-containing protein n=1 Tax=Candidatus Anaerobiospirillum pullicola TaxID=2838451 RepID=A0A948TGE3_9GAMM|nr:substrate-binding domain-containing protein [Candidatus Anaerobiospirillum pullicola]